MAIRIRHAEDGMVENSDINVTPFIDVMLVLLIIFMVTAPLSTVSIPVKLPVAKAAPETPPAPPLYVTLQADGTTAVGDMHVGGSALAAAVVRASRGDRERQIYLRGDENVGYGKLMALLNILRDAGYLKVALVGMPGAKP